MSAPDRVAVVTGASRGIGAYITRALADDGYAVCLLARDGSAAARVAALTPIAGATHLAGWAHGIRALTSHRASSRRT